jgi:hypothetical protein
MVSCAVAPIELPLPKMIGICGYPKHGKSTAQRFLELLGVEARDDAKTLREGAMKEFGLTYEQVTTQEGKAQLCEAFGTTMTVRQALGDYGQVYERAYGPNYWVEQAVEQLRAERVQHPISFGSLRRSQPSVIKANGGFVLAINNPDGPKVIHDFDHYDYDYVDNMVFNDSSLMDLATRVLIAVTPYLQITGAQADAALDQFEKEVGYGA